MDDTLTLLFLCCHPSLSAPSQLALTLRAVGGLTTAEIANAFLVPEATMAQRISRAKQSIKAAGAPLRAAARRRTRRPPARRAAGALPRVQRGLHDSSGPTLQRADLTAEAIRLARLLHALLPDEGEVAGLLALMLLTDARRAARTEPDGTLVPLAEQDRASSGTRADRRRRRADHATLGSGAARPVPAPGRDRGRARRGAERGGDRLAADPRALRRARTCRRGRSSR